MTKQNKYTALTKRLLRVIHLAAQEAHMVNEKNIRPEHLLLGLIHEQGGMGAEILRRLGVYEDEIRRDMAMTAPHTLTLNTMMPPKSLFLHLLHWFSRTPQRQIQPVLGLSEVARQALARARQEAQRLEVNFVGTEHLLFGLVGIDESGLGRVFKRLQIDENKIHDYIVRFYAHAGILG